MKEFLASIFSSTISIPNRRSQKFSKGLIAVLLLVASFFFASTNISIAQPGIPGTASISTVVADPTISQWKNTVEYSAVITSMKTSTTKILENPNTPPAERTLYTGFDRLLTYIQSDIEAHHDLTKIAEKNYNQVVQEASSDPVLINMSMGEFAVLYNSLVDKLHQ
jgi:hypothetical protein